jgi:hypothetical protein
MAFTTLETRPGLREPQRARLRTMSPGRVFAPAGYASMLRRAKFSVLEQRDVTEYFEATLQAWISAYTRHRTALTKQISAAAVTADLHWYEDRLTAVREGLIRRMLYVVER